MRYVLTPLCAIGAVALALLATDVVSSNIGLVVCMAALIAAVMLGAIYYRAERRLPFLSDPVVLTCAFFAQFYVIGPVSLPLFDWHIHVALPIELVVRTMLAFLLLLVCFVIGYQIRLGTIIADHLPDFGGGRLKLSGRFAEALVLLPSLYGCMLYVNDRGGLLSVLSRGYGQGSYYSGFYQLPFHTLILGTLMMGWRIADAPRTTKLDKAIFFGLLFGELLFYGIVLGTRNRLFFLFFGLYTVWAMRRGISRFWKMATVPVLALLLVFFAVWGAVRARPVDQLVSGSSMNQMYGDEASYMGYFSSVAEPFAVACMLMDMFPTVQPFRHGSTLLVTVFALIPRAMWPDKPVGFGKEVTRFTDGVFYTPTHGHSLTVTFLGDFWVNAGWLGVVGGGLIFGLIARVMSSYATAGMTKGGLQFTPSRVLIAAIFAASLAEVRAESATILMFWGLMGPWLFLSLLFFKLDYSDRGGTLTHPESRPARAPLGEGAR